MKTKGILNLVLMITALLATLAIGFAMIGDVLIIPKIPVIVTQVAGWIIVIGAIISAIAAILKKI